MNRLDCGLRGVIPAMVFVSVLTAPAVHRSADAALPEGMTVVERRLPASVIEQTHLPDRSRWVRVRSEVPRELNGLSYRAPDGYRWAFYGRERDRSGWVTVCRTDDDVVVASDERRVVSIATADAGRLETPSELRWRFFHNGLVIDYGGIVLFDSPCRREWDFYWIRVEQAPEAREFYAVDFEDGFMRTSFGSTDRWTCVGGAHWQLKQYGGGMPTTEREARSANYRRASNPFTLVGESGEARYGEDDWSNLQVEARFFFGRPGSFADRDTLVRTVLGGEPVYADKEAIYQSDQIHEYPETDFYVVQGRAGGFRVAFGWSRENRRFQLQSQFPGQEQWNVIRYWDTRPPFTNWIRVGLGMSRGCRALPFLDSEQLGAYRLPFAVHGPFSLMAGNSGNAEVDDIAAWSYPRPLRHGTSVFSESAVFAQKELLDKKDKQTGQWTRSELTFQDDQAEMRGHDMELMKCQFPMYGDFTYRARTDVPGGEYCFAIVDEKERPYCLSFFDKNSKGWRRPGGEREFGLEIARRRGHLLQRIRGRWDLLTGSKVSAPAWIVIGTENDTPLQPDQHAIYSKSLVNDLFEHAPSKWAWREGNFRMDVRWQCQRGWNFMMGKSRDVAVMYSKDAYSGDQEVEFHMALRFVTPPPYYVLRDMGFAFCTDGKSLASGYNVIYGDGDNTKTTLLRKGEPVEESPSIIRHKPGANIHNYWWHGKIVRTGKRIRVEIDDETVFDFTDRRPLDGGHIAFWTIRNAISLAKVSINAESAKPEPEIFRLPADPLTYRSWYPLNPDEVVGEELLNGHLRVSNQVGGGTFAVRWDAPDGGKDLDRSSLLTIPVEQDRDTRLGIHLQVSGRSFYYPFTAPKENIRYLLTPEFENADPVRVYRQKPFSEEKIEDFLVSGRHSRRQVQLDLREACKEIADARLESITIGNSSNRDYLLLGAGGNPEGASYTVGEPEWR